MKHTQGEWTLEKSGIISSRQPIKTIATVNKSILSMEEDLANAKLISAAPDLLESLIYLKSMFGINKLPESIENKINNAIKKATE